MAPSAPTSPLRQLLEERLLQLSHEMQNLFGESRDRARRELADHLNQAVRRLRQSSGATELAATLVDSASAFAHGAALFRVESGLARGERIHGVGSAETQAFQELSIPLSSAAALAGAVESKDPVIAAASESEVSPEVAKLLGHDPESRVAVFPVVVKDRVVALLYGWGTVQAGAMELLAQVASYACSALPVEAPQLVQLEAAPAQPESAWDRLSADEQRLHLRAQREARVQVAEMRLFEAEAVRVGRLHGDLYDALRKQIDKARLAFHANFFAACPSMVDYLHLEIVRTLANDDPALLGKSYPGPLV